MASRVKKMVGKEIKSVKEIPGRIVKEGVNGVNGLKWIRVAEKMTDSFGNAINNGGVEVKYLLLAEIKANGNLKIVKATKE